MCCTDTWTMIDCDKNNFVAFEMDTQGDDV